MVSVIIQHERGTEDERYLCYEACMVLPREWVLSVMRWSPAMQEHPGAKEFRLKFNKWFHTAMNTKEPLATMHAITDGCP